MPDELDRSVDLEFAKMLLVEVGNLEANRIAVRVHPSSTNDNSQRHWRRANLKGVHGKQLIVRPLNGHKKDEYVDPSHVRLWQSRMPDELVQTVIRLRKKQEAARVAKSAQVQIQTAINEVFEPSKPIIEIEKPMKTIDPLPAIPPSFSEQLNLYKELKLQIAQRAKGEGIDRLKKLHEDRADAMKMLESIEGEITSVVSELNEFGVPIPLELCDVDPAPSDDNSRTGLASSVGVKGTGWSMKKARKYKPAIVEWLKKQPDGNWYSSRQIMAAIGDSETAPSTVIVPLVADGTLERTGERADSRYRLQK